jgi:predicted RNase H-like nuclease
MDRALALWVGIDLAWGTRNPSGLTMLEWREDGLAEVEPTQLVYTDEEICRVIAEQDAGNTLVIAVDAPLVVPNLTGERPVEGEMRRRFARCHAACHPANRRLLGEPPRGERLCAMLAERFNVQLAPAPPVRQACRVAFEVYPHAAMVRLFHLPRILEYKARSGRDMAYRRGQMQRYVGLLKQLPVPKLYLPDWLSEVPETPAGLKRFEDRLDALFCAWLAARAWWYGGEVLGEAHTGTIWLPAQEYELPTQNIETQP